VRISDLVTKDLPSFVQKLTLSSYSAEQWGQCFTENILYAIEYCVKSKLSSNRTDDTYLALIPPLSYRTLGGK
jgi:hypothetical protein